jgi:cation diffusion facilitator family transporter
MFAMLKNTDLIQIRAIRQVMLISILIMAIKFIAYYFTGSTAILTDALESIVNVVAGGFALFSMYFALRPKDLNHPYGHGKIEFLSAGLEGVLIFIAGIFIVGKATFDIISQSALQRLDLGLILSGVAGGANFFLGKYLIKTGEKHRSIALIANGKHLQTDTITTVGLISGIALIYLSGWLWLDSVLAIVFAFFFFATGYKLVRKSLAGLLDETDTAIIEEVVEHLQTSRKNDWIDLHNLRVLQYGSSLHIDCHITMPWYYSLAETHNRMDDIEVVLKNAYPDKVEVFVHADPCMAHSCEICCIDACNVRRQPFKKRIEWSAQNTLANEKHNALTAD